MQVSFLATSDVSWWDIFSPSFSVQFYCFWWLNKTSKNGSCNRSEGDGLERICDQFMEEIWWNSNCYHGYENICVKKWSEFFYWVFFLQDWYNWKWLELPSSQFIAISKWISSPRTVLSHPMNTAWGSEWTAVPESWVHIASSMNASTSSTWGTTYSAFENQ